MSLSFGSSRKKTTSSAESNPWAPTIPGLEELVGAVTPYIGRAGATSGMTDAYSQLLQNAQSGNPYAGDMASLTTDLFNTGSRSGVTDKAYADLQRNLGDVASGTYLDVANNPYLAKASGVVGNDIQNRINSLFAGSGRSISGNTAGIQAMSRGLESGLAPLYLNQYNQERQNQSQAANQLFGGAATTATTGDQLDSNALLNRLRGVQSADATMAARDYGPNQVLNLEQQMKNLPLQDLALIESLLGPIAQLGGTQTGTSTTKGTSFGGSVNIMAALGALLSDERMKEDAEKVGELADGTPIYRFRYAKQIDPMGVMHIGVMAQQVEQDNPDAISSFGGMKMVDYGKVTDKSAKMLKNDKEMGGYGFA